MRLPWLKELAEAGMVFPIDVWGMGITMLGLATLSVKLLVKEPLKIVILDYWL
jgi:hypothetical protein